LKPNENNQPKTTTMKLQIETSAFNDRRYGKPWIAAVSFANGAKGEFTFGDWIGSHGSAGLLLLDNVKPGDVIARGQKDNRGQAYKSSPDYYQVDAEGELNGLPTPAAAYKAWRENEAAKTEAEPSYDERVQRFLVKVAGLNKDAGEIGAGMLAQIVDEATSLIRI
jgi:hypothetical protein